MNSNNYSNLYWMWRIERLLDLYLHQAGEDAKIVSIEPETLRVIDVINGRRQWQTLPGYFGVIVSLSKPITSVTKLRHVLDQTVNADVKIPQPDKIILTKRPLFEAPYPV